jgi:guanylate kinase
LSNQGKILVVSAPSGSGKTTLLKSVLKEFPEIVYSVSATTRQKRNNEINGIDYFFISEKEFKEKIERNEFAEWEKFYDYYYGTLKSYLDEKIKCGATVLLEVDVKGALSVKKSYSNAKLIFIVPPSWEELVRRLKNRQTENEEDLRKRIERARMELSLKNEFDYFVNNNNLIEAIQSLKDLISKLNIGE